MPPRDRAYYLSLRQRYEPKPAKLVIIAESPPASGLYFYDVQGKTSEPLFAAFMKQLGVSPATKADRLREFQQRGWVLVDATYAPIDKLKGASRNNVIIRYYPLLRDDLARLNADRSAPLILIKTNVCELLEPKLAADGYNVLNGRRSIYFPGHGRQNDFARQFRAVVSEMAG